MAGRNVPNETAATMILNINQSISQFYVFDMSDDNLPYLMGLSGRDKMACRIILILSLFCGTFFRLLVLRVVKHNGWFQLPINAMIFLEEVSTMVAYSTMILIAMVFIELEEPLGNYTGLEFCQGAMLVCTIGFAISPWVKVGIALMRLIYIKYSVSRRSEGWTVCIFSTLATTIGTVTGIIFVMAPRRAQDVQTICQGYSLDMAMTLYDIRAPNHEPIVAQLCILSTLVAYTIQFSFYLVILKHILQHDKTMVSLLSETTINKRRRRSAIDLTGQVIFFVLTGFLTITLFFGSHWMSRSNRFWTLMMYKSTYGIVGICHIVSSPPLRHELKTFLQPLIRRKSLEKD